LVDFGILEICVGSGEICG